MSKPLVEGIVVATITPYTKDLKIDVDGLKWLLTSLANDGVNGGFIPGTAGEWPLLSLEDRKLVLESAVEAVKGKIKVLSVLPSFNLEEAINNARVVKEIDVDAVAATPPLYFKPTPDKLIEFFIKIADTADKPTLIYTIPSNVGYNVPVEVVYKTAIEHSSIAGIKATVDDLHYIHNVISEVKSVRRDFTVLAGYGEYMLATLIAGGDGAIDAYSNLVPKLTAKIYGSWKDGRIDEAIKLHRELVDLASSMRRVSCLQSAISYYYQSWEHQYCLM